MKKMDDKTFREHVSFFEYLKSHVEVDPSSWMDPPWRGKTSSDVRRHFAFDECIRLTSNKSKPHIFNPHIYVHEGRTSLFTNAKEVFDKKAHEKYEQIKKMIPNLEFNDFFLWSKKESMDDNGQLYGAVAQVLVPLSSFDINEISDEEKQAVVLAYSVLTESEKAIGIKDADFGNRRRRTSNAELNVRAGFPGRNYIVFGAPGTGKSNWLETQRKKKRSEVQISDETSTEEEDNATDGDSEELFFKEYKRVTFYPTYAYAQFVGAYKPVMRKVDGQGVELEEQNAEGHFRKAISYQFTPGPFLEILKNAIRDEDNNYLLIIEEINRANASAVFGDVFQLLDRDEDGDSEYSIFPSEEVVEYLMADDRLGDGLSEDEAKEIRIPSNLYIWATMNSADQGVFPLDTAFKRRWDFKYMKLDGEKGNNDKAKIQLHNNSSCKWGALRIAINKLLSRCGVNEDKLLSSFFIKGSSIEPDTFEMKVLMYLWEDAARMCRNKVFQDKINTFSELLDAWSKVCGGDGEEKTGEVLFTSVFNFDVNDNAPRPELETKESGDKGNGGEPAKDVEGDAAPDAASDAPSPGIINGVNPKANVPSPNSDETQEDK